MEQSKRKWLRRTDLWVIAGLVAVAALLYFGMNWFAPKEDLKAEIYYESTKVEVIQLNRAQDSEFSLDAAPNVHFEIHDHQIRFVNVNCPDKICEQAGYLKKAGDAAVCMPNRVSVKLVSDTGQATDA